MARRKAVGDAEKGVTITTRISPKTKFLMELLARRQRRSATAVIEWLVAQAAETELTWENLGITPTAEPGQNPRSLVDALWDPSETQRLANLGKYAPMLMTFEEEFAYRVIHNDPVPWVAGFFESLNEQPEEDAESIKSMTVEDFAEMIKARSKANPHAPLTRNSRERR